MPAEVALTISEAVTLLDPPISEKQLRLLVTALRWKPASRRRTGHAGHPTYAYDAAELMKLHAAIAPWLPAKPD